MTKAEAVLKALGWWEAMILSGHWNNGNRESERQHSFFTSLAPRPTQGELAVIRPFFLKLLQAKAEHPNTLTGQLYSDYGNREIDAVFQAGGTSLRSGLHAPQKAGTWFEQDKETGEYSVKAKSGYGQEWETL